MKDAFDSSRYYRVKQVVDTLSVSRSTIYHWIKKEEFPAPKKFGPALSAWFGYELNEWCCRKNSEARN
ncbi:MAG: helix-turn-helix transcriptional regulator [Desulfobulbus sp.]